MPVRISMTWRHALVIIALLFVNAAASADSLDDACTYQGRLAYEGNALNGPCDLRFTLWDAANAGATIGSTLTYPDVPVVNGLFTVKLDFGGDAFAGDQRWLGIEARYPAGTGPYVDLAPRQAVTAAPYSLYAVTAGNASGTTNRLAKFTNQRRLGDSVLHESAGKIGLGTTSPATHIEVVSSDAPTIRTTSSSLPTRFVQMMYHGSIGPLVQGGSGYDRLTIDANSGGGPGKIVLGAGGDRVGIGELNPLARLEVVATEEIGGKFTTDFPGAFTHALHGEYVGADLEDAIGVYGRSWPATDWGYGGWFEGGEYGLFATGGLGAAKFSGPTVVESGFGVPLTVTLGPPTPNSLPYPRAVHGEYTGDLHDDVIGVYGRAWPAMGFGYGGQFEGGDYGIYAWGGTGAAYFGGSIYVDGVVTKAGGNFQIDHPLDPLNKTLSHSFVESPDMMNVYNGNVVLDDAGEAVVTLPEYFDALNRDFRYQLTPIGAPMPRLHVAREIDGNVFAIAGGEPGKKVSWQITGVREDPWAEQNRIEVEQYKPDRQRGSYLHPEAYGQKLERGIRRPPRREGGRP